MIECTNICKTYVNGDVETKAVSGISFKIDKGEFVAIIGPSGSGKSTLMHILGLLHAPDPNHGPQPELVFGGRDKLLHCVKRENGKPVWSFATHGKVDSSPAICGNKVVVGSDDGRLYLVSLDKGQELWSYEVGQPVASSPAVARERIVVGCDDGNVYCFGGK